MSNVPEIENVHIRKEVLSGLKEESQVTCSFQQCQSIVTTRMSPWWSLCVACIYRMPGGIIVNDSGICRCVQFVTTTVRAQLLPIFEW